MGDSNRLRASVVNQGTETSDVELILRERGSVYGDAWKHTGIVLNDLGGSLDELLRGPYAFAWIMIQNKLTRALRTPNDPDHWKDIAGYATLVYNDLVSEENLDI